MMMKNILKYLANIWIFFVFKLKILFIEEFNELKKILNPSIVKGAKTSRVIKPNFVMENPSNGNNPITATKIKINAK